MNLIKVFENTRRLSNGKYLDDTREVINNTIFYGEGQLEMEIQDNSNLEVEVIPMRTVEALYYYKKQYDNIAILNFANALAPGGMVLHGAMAQEESICRCSNLYESLIGCPKYYSINKKLLNIRGHIYSDSIIYSPNVLFFKDDTTYELVSPIYGDVITCPAPATMLPDDKAFDIYCSRIENILKSAIINNVDCLILGAWGCGAFGQNPQIMAKAFKYCLGKYNNFKKVVFAIMDSNSINFKEFKNVLEENMMKQTKNKKGTKEDRKLADKRFGNDGPKGLTFIPAGKKVKKGK